jgi:hypothetical protein
MLYRRAEPKLILNYYYDIDFYRILNTARGKHLLIEGLSFHYDSNIH